MVRSQYHKECKSFKNGLGYANWALENETKEAVLENHREKSQKMLLTYTKKVYFS